MLTGPSGATMRVLATYAPRITMFCSHSGPVIPKAVCMVSFDGTKGPLLPLSRNSLERLAADRTTFVIAHRLSTIRNAQEIIVLTENGIEETGTHEELLQKNGVYASLYQWAK